MIIIMIVIMMIMILLPVLLPIITIIKDAWTNFDSQIYYTLFAENDSKQITKERTLGENVWKN